MFLAVALQLICDFFDTIQFLRSDIFLIFDVKVLSDIGKTKNPSGAGQCIGSAQVTG